jgi:hypothetical protein
MSATAPHPRAARRAVHIEISDEDKAALWAMSFDHRIAAMWAGQLTHGQLLEWTHARPDQIPNLGGEFAWLMMFTPEWPKPPTTTATTSCSCRTGAKPVPPHDVNHLDGADIRGFYAALGIPLPGWAGTDVSVRCFADPEAHARGDRDPSCSVNLTHGAWHCHGCGASGGPFDAAIYQGLSSRSAIDLMICHGLTQRRAPASHQPARGTLRRADVRPRPKPPPVAPFTVGEADVRRWREALNRDVAMTERLVHHRAWRPETMHLFEVGAHRGRITIPLRDHRRRLLGPLRYRPSAGRGQIKMQATAGSRRQLLPHPAAAQSPSVVLVEGEPDMIAARSHGLPAIALPGTDSWKDEWAIWFAGREVAVVMDCDPQGRAVSARIADALANVADVKTVDLAPNRDDGYDLTDWILAGTPNAETIDLGSPVKVRAGDG